MPNYCPGWVFDCLISQSSIDFIEIGHGINFICTKYSNGLSGTYEDISSQEIEEGVKFFLNLLSEHSINEGSVNLLKQFIYFRFNYSNRFVKRNFKSIFSDPLKPRKKKVINNVKSLNGLKTFLFEWRSTANVKIEPGWALGNQKEFISLAELVNKPLSEHERKIILRETRKAEVYETWVKK